MKNDARVLRTREKLFDAYLHLISKKPHGDITIQELTSLAGINRITFYKHFQNLADFQMIFIQDHITALYTHLKPLNYKPYSNGFEYEALVHFLTYIHEHADVYKTLFTSEYFPQFNRELLLFFQNKVSQHTEELGMFHFPGTNVDKEIVSWYGASALLGTTLMWVQRNFPYTPEQLAKSISKLNANSF